mgnify:CR=1 FL=1
MPSKAPPRRRPLNPPISRAESDIVFEVRRQVSQHMLVETNVGVRCEVCKGTGLGGASVEHRPDCAFAKLMISWGYGMIMSRD